MKNLQMEMAKVQATLNNLISSVRAAEEGKTTVDVLGSLYALQDQVDSLDDVINETV